MAQEGLLGGEGLRGEGRLNAGRRKDTNLGAAHSGFFDPITPNTEGSIHNDNGRRGGDDTLAGPEGMMRPNVRDCSGGKWHGEEQWDTLCINDMYLH